MEYFEVVLEAGLLLDIYVLVSSSSSVIFGMELEQSFEMYLLVLIPVSTIRWNLELFKN
jgi:hypothetical protein